MLPVNSYSYAIRTLKAKRNDCVGERSDNSAGYINGDLFISYYFQRTDELFIIVERSFIRPEGCNARVRTLYTWTFTSDGRNEYVNMKRIIRPGRRTKRNSEIRREPNEIGASTDSRQQRARPKTASSPEHKTLFVCRGIHDPIRLRRAFT